MKVALDMNTVRKLVVKDRKKLNLETHASFKFEIISVVAGWLSSGRHTLTLRRKLLLPVPGKEMSYPIRMKV